MKFLLFVAALLHVALVTAGHVVSVQVEAASSEIPATSFSADETDSTAAETATQRGAAYVPFAELAPRQKVMGVINTIAILRTKAALLEDMKSAFEPRSTGDPTGFLYDRLLPGPALAYGDCRLGILPFSVCRHLGFLATDPMVAPSSTQSKLLRLTAASCLITSFSNGHLDLLADPDLNAILGQELLASATQALASFWNCQLMTPAFDIRGASLGSLRDALRDADTFLFQVAMQAKEIIRFSRQEYNEVAAFLAALFSESELSAAGHREEKPQHTGRAVRSIGTQIPEPARSLSRQEESDIFGGFLSRLFTSQQSEKPPESVEVTPFMPVSPTEIFGSTQFAGLAGSLGNNLTSLVHSTARSAAKLVNGEAPLDDAEVAASNEATGRRVNTIVDMLPENVDGQFR
ncbi:uncharacterized protein LOC34620808 [Cyclospora cayetanensis]|uniref:Uncharacterized protein LOC34620808 n=2 Tax=Cyclospora cayetanensis TaxID=88456 RepID=A0A6P5WDZ2_9EIME|nr:uncharacterized protein LOC34620808 [Cyclospora cayetanensis]OEH79640.1 hypothetical protein cyc_04252 [Cyclospora cayetanensis]